MKSKINEYQGTDHGQDKLASLIVHVVTFVRLSLLDTTQLVCNQ